VINVGTRAPAARTHIYAGTAPNSGATRCSVFAFAVPKSVPKLSQVGQRWSAFARRHATSFSDKRGSHHSAARRLLLARTGGHGHDRRSVVRSITCAKRHAPVATASFEAVATAAGADIPAHLWMMRETYPTRVTLSTTFCVRRDLFADSLRSRIRLSIARTLQ
jgi:hypothetical protein